MSLALKRIKLENILENNKANGVKPSRELMLDLIDSFSIFNSPFLSEQEWDKEFKNSVNWMIRSAQIADASWLTVLHEIFLNPPEEKNCGWREDFQYDFNAFLEKLAELFPVEAGNIFGDERKGFNTPD